MINLELLIEIKHDAISVKSVNCKLKRSELVTPSTCDCEKISEAAVLLVTKTVISLPYQHAGNIKVACVIVFLNALCHELTRGVFSW